MIKEYILEYLDKNWVIKSKKLYWSDGTPTYGLYAVNDISLCFNLTFDDAIKIFDEWAKKDVIEYADWFYLLNPPKLNIRWSPELVQDIRSLSAIDAELELIQFLYEMIEKELGKVFHTKINTLDAFLSAMRGLGYTLSPTYYDANSFTPYKTFILMHKDELRNVRQNHIIWKNTL